jgi:hypothetical protein
VTHKEFDDHKAAQVIQTADQKKDVADRLDRLENKTDTLILMIKKGDY